MESQPQNPEFRIHSENFHPCNTCISIWHLWTRIQKFQNPGWFFWLLARIMGYMSCLLYLHITLLAYDIYGGKTQTFQNPGWFFGLFAGIMGYMSSLMYLRHNNISI